MNECEDERANESEMNATFCVTAICAAAAAAIRRGTKSGFDASRTKRTRSRRRPSAGSLPEAVNQQLERTRKGQERVKDLELEVRESEGQ